MSASVDAILLLTIILSILLNGSVIAALTRKWKDLNAHDVILLSLSICDFCQVTIAYPLGVGSNLQENNIKCIVVGFSTLSLALVSISTITSMSIGRMISISYPLKCYRFMEKKRNSLYLIIPSLFYGFMWACFPLFGWSKYVPESEQRCSINLYDHHAGTISYLYSLLIFCYVLPVIIMILSFIKNKKQFIKMRRFNNSMKRAANGTTGSMERRYTRLVLVMVIAFLLAWTPYAIVVFLVSFNKKVSLVWSDFAALIGKTSSCYNPIIYAFLYGKYRLAVAELLSIGKNNIQSMFRKRFAVKISSQAVQPQKFELSPIDTDMSISVNPTVSEFDHNHIHQSFNCS